jgi:predicted AAA+ superfamily ATPase
LCAALFEGVFPASAGKASAGYHALYERVADNLPALMPKHAITIEYAERLRACYPLHPRLLDTAENRLSVLPDYNLSRGTLRLFARLIRDLWDSGEDPEAWTIF